MCAYSIRYSISGDREGNVYNWDDGGKKEEEEEDGSWKKNCADGRKLRRNHHIASIAYYTVLNLDPSILL